MKKPRRPKPSLAERLADRELPPDPSGVYTPQELAWVRQYRASDHWAMWHATLEWLRDVTLMDSLPENAIASGARLGKLEILSDLLQNGPLRVVQYRRLDQQNMKTEPEPTPTTPDLDSIRPAPILRGTL